MSRLFGKVCQNGYVVRDIDAALRFFGDDAKYDPRPYTVRLPFEPTCAPGEHPDDDRLFPLMFPGSTPTDAAFIANHHYRQIQKLLEDLGR